MKQKSLIVVICLVLALVTLSAASAVDNETVTTITVKPGALLADNEMLNQISDAATLRVHSMPEGYGALSISLNDVDAVSALLKVEENGVYLQSQLLGVTPLYFSWEDLKTLMTEQMENNPDMFATSPMFGGEMFQAMMDGSMTEEDAMEMMGMDQELMDFAADIENAQVVETGAFSLDGSDIADQKTVTVVTKDDMVRAVELPFVRKMLTNQLVMESPELTEEEITAQVDAQIAEAKQALEEGNLAVTVTTYTKGDELVALEYVYDMVVEEQPIVMSFTMTKTSMDKAAFYQVKFKIADPAGEYANQYGSLYVGDDFVSGKLQLNSFENAPVLTADFNYDTSEPGQKTGEFILTAYDAGELGFGSLLLTYDQQMLEAAKNTEISFYVGTGNAEELKAALAENRLISIQFSTVTQPDSGFFAYLQAATPETSVQPLQMSESELNAYLEAIQQSMTISLLTVMENLPPELSNSLVEEMGAY